MTRREFVEDVTTFWELIEFCQNEGIAVCDDIMDADYADDVLNEKLREFDDWKDAVEYLRDIPQGCEYYCVDGYGNYEDADGMFDDYKEDVLDVMDDLDRWDEDDEDDEEDDEEDECPETEAVDETMNQDDDADEIDSSVFATILEVA